MIIEARKEDEITQGEWKGVEMILEMIVRDRQLNSLYTNILPTLLERFTDIIAARKR